MYTLLVILAILAAIFMIGIVLIQSSKEGDLICRFGRYINLLVDKKSFNIVERTTLVIGGVIVIMCVICAYVVS